MTFDPIRMKKIECLYRAAVTLAEYLRSSNLDMGKGPTGFHLSISPRRAGPKHPDDRDIAAREFLAAVAGVTSTDLAVLHLPDGEYICTRCGLREQRGEAPKGEF